MLKDFPKEHLYFEAESGILYCGDCREILKTLPSSSIDLILTSPPYNLGIEYDEWNDNLPYDEYLQLIESFLKESFRVLKKDGRIVINHYLSCGTSEFRFAPLMDINYIATRNIGFKHHGIGIWMDRTISKATAWGSWLSPSAPYVNSPLEGFLILYKDQWKKEKKGKSSISKEDFILFTRGIWEIPPERNRDHPAPFPEKIAKLVIECLTYEGDVVLDPFAGSGTTLVVAEKLKRKWIGIEISKNYCKMIKNRILSNTLSLFSWRGKWLNNTNSKC